MPGTAFPTLPLFVYGTLKRKESNYVSFLAGRTVREQPASLPGAALYTEGPYPYLVLDDGLAAPDDQVQGTLMTIRPDLYLRLMQQIDRLEDYIPNDPFNEYERIVSAVQTDTGPVEAWVYVAGTRIAEAIRAGKLRKIAGGVWGR